MRKIIQCLLAMCVMTSAGSALAVDATLSFTGNILPPSCTITSQTADQTITLDTALVIDLASATTARPKAFNVQLTNCTTSAKVTMAVSGTVDTVASVLKNTGTAKQIGIQLLRASAVGSTSGTALTLNSAISLGTVDATNAMTIPFVAQYYRLGTVVPGTVTAVATIDFTYN